MCKVDGSVLPEEDVAKHLGFWWRGDILSVKMVEETFAEQYVHYGNIGVSQRDLNPLSVRSVVDTCHVMLFGCENWGRLPGILPNRFT